MVVRKIRIAHESGSYRQPACQFGDECIHQAFHVYQNRFAAITITRRAKSRFENRDWNGMASDAAERLVLYAKAGDRVLMEVRHTFKQRKE